MNNALLDLTIADGFDRSSLNSDGTVNVRCSQCEALVINSHACHETGCPTDRRIRREREAEERHADLDLDDAGYDTGDFSAAHRS